MTLAPHQVESVDCIHRDFETYQKLLLVMATGGGKTCVFSTIANHCVNGYRAFKRRGKVLVLCNRELLTKQTAEEVLRWTGTYCGIEQAENTTTLDSPIVVACDASMDNRLHRYPKDHFDLVVVDEAHLMAGARAQRVINHFDAKVLGTTATPYNKGKRALSKFYDCVTADISLTRLIKAGWLAPVTISLCPLKIDISQVSTHQGDLNAEELSTSIEPYFDLIAQEMKKHPYRQWLCFLPVIEASRRFTRVLNRNGICAQHVDGAMDNEVALATFARGHIEVLCCSQLLYFGFNQPRIDGIVNLRQTKSINFYEQAIGRGTRKSEDSLKNDCLVLDFLWQYPDLGLVRPSFIVTKDEEESEEMQKRIETATGPINLVELHDEVVKDRHAKLKELLHENAKKKRRVISILDVALECNADLISDYEPVSEWQQLPATQAQLSVLERHGIDVDEVKDKGHASNIIGWLHQRIELGLATLKQLAMLNRLGIRHNPETMTFKSASTLIDSRI